MVQENGPNPDMARTLNNLGKLCRDQQRFSEAETCFLHAQAIQEQVLLPDHPDVAETLHEMARLYQMQERFEEAEFYFLFALEVFEQAPNHTHKSKEVFEDYRALLYHLGQPLPHRFASWG